MSTSAHIRAISDAAANTVIGDLNVPREGYNTAVETAEVVLTADNIGGDAARRTRKVNN